MIDPRRKPDTSAYDAAWLANEFARVRAAIGERSGIVVIDETTDEPTDLAKRILAEMTASGRRAQENREAGA
jgi:hypothetical protein